MRDNPVHVAVHGEDPAVREKRLWRWAPRAWTAVLSFADTEGYPYSVRCELFPDRSTGGPAPGARA